MNYSLMRNQALVFYGNINEFYDHDCLRVLSEKEIARSQQFHGDADKRRYIISRAILKQLLSTFLNINGKKIALDYSKNGKPFLPGNHNLRFNISHSENAFVIGFVQDLEIGIDVESLNKELNILKLQTYLFTSTEQKLFDKIDNHLMQETFINLWTQKEAFLKATGEGLTKPMNKVDLSLIMDKNIAESACPENKNSWFVESYTVMKNYRGALVVKGLIKDVQYIPISASEWLFNNAG